MAREFSRWFRFYDSVLDDPKAQKLTDPMFRAWVNLLCLANRNGGMIPADMSALAFSLRTTEAKVKGLVDALSRAGLMDVSETFLIPHNWSERQFKSDVSTERVKRFRQRSMKQDGNGFRNRSETVSETAPEQNRTEQSGCLESHVNSPILPSVQNKVSARDEGLSPASPSSASGLEGQSSEGNSVGKVEPFPGIAAVRARNGR